MAQPASPAPSMSRPVVIIGNLTIDDVIHPDGTSQMGTLGGNSVHAAAAALAWTSEVGIVARSGADFPAAALGRLRDAGADISGIRQVDGPTVRNWVIYEADGRRSWVYRTPRGRGAQVAPQPPDIPREWLARQPPPVVHIAAMPLVRAAAVARSVRDRAPGAVVLLDTHEDWPPGGQLLEAASAVDVFLPSREELAALLGHDDPDRAASELTAAGVGCVVVKLGGDGALVARPGTGHVRVPAFPATVADPTGAGDSFCGAFAAGLALGDDPVAAARRGCATAAAAIGASGSLRLLDRRSLARHLLAGDLPAGDPLAGDARRPAGSGQADRAVAGGSGAGVPDDAYDIGVMRKEMATIPEVIAGHLGDPGGYVTRLAGWLAQRRIRHVFLTGCGDSVFAAMASSLAFRRHSRLEAHPVHALDLARYRVRYLPPGSAVIAISVSGRAGRTTEAAVQAATFGHPVAALTNNPAGPLAAAADVIVPIDVPMLGSTPGTSTYIGMLCTLIDLALRTSDGSGARAACGELAGLAAVTLDACDAPAAEIAARMADARFVTYLGAGPNEATACFGAAKLFEAPQRVALAVNLEEWAHEQYFITGPGDPVVVVAPAGAAHDRAGEILSELRFLHADAIVVSDLEPPGPATTLRLAGHVPEELSPVLAALPLAQVGFHLARQTGKRSYNFPSEQARDEHYATIHRATIGEPA